MSMNKQTAPQTGSVAIGKERNYNEVVEFLNANWSSQDKTRSLQTIMALDKALQSPSKKLKSVLVGGTNGKSLTIHFATKLLMEEKITVGAFYTPHLLSYNERFVINNESISNKAFTDCANDVINAAEAHNIKADTLDILTMIAFLHFKQNNVDIAFLEMNSFSPNDPVHCAEPVIQAITRITEDNMLPQSEETIAAINDLLANLKNGTHVISGDQSKLNLQIMADVATQKGGSWAMPIRKLAPLAYPFEQLHGRCAALAERICQIYVDHFMSKDAIIFTNSLLAKEKGQRGRPTLEAKRKSELNPRRTVEQFWKDEVNELAGRFQLLDKEKPSILLDNASNIDALKNLLLGVRLLNYQRTLKGLTLIFGCDKNGMDNEEFLRLLRYFCKKNSAQVIFCPITQPLPGMKTAAWNVDQITNDLKSLKVKARTAKNFADAFEMAKKTIDERHGLLVITGSQSIVAEYWHHKGIKKI